MLDGIKSRINAVAALANRITVTDEVEPQLLDKFEPKDLPAVVLLYGENRYLPRENEMHPRQLVDKRVVAYLYCLLSEQDSLEQQLVQAALGFKHDAAVDHGLEAVGSVSKKVKIEYVIRRIEFSQTSRVVGTP